MLSVRFSGEPVAFRVKRNAEAGDAWTWMAIDADSKLCIWWLVGWQDSANAAQFMRDVESRLANRVQLTTDQLSIYLRAVDVAFMGEVAYAMLQKLCAGGGDGRYSPAECIGCKKVVVNDHPDTRHASTSFVEGQNLTMRMNTRRVTRLTNAFSKKVENHAHSVALFHMHYHFCRVHQLLHVTPAQEAGLTQQVWSIMPNRPVSVDPGGVGHFKLTHYPTPEPLNPEPLNPADS